MRLTVRIFFFSLLFSGSTLSAQVVQPDSAKVKRDSGELFYDSLKTKAYRHGLTRFLYRNIVIERPAPEDLDFHYRLLRKYRGRTIASVQYKPLDVFGPTFQDTARRPESKIGEFGNRLHTTTNPKIIEKNVLIEVGDTLDVDKILENERVIRSLSFIKDVRFLVSPTIQDTNMVDLTVLTKDVFSFGIGVHFSGIDAGRFEMYNQNIWGIGHEINAKVVGNVNKEPYIGFEGSYVVSNIAGNFVNFTSTYANTYRKEGVSFDFEKEFLLSTTRWGGGWAFYRLTRSDHLVNYDRYLTEYPLDYKTIDVWSGYAFRLRDDPPSGDMQLVF